MTGVIVLIGMMGSGKTAVGRRLAGRLGFRFVDTDESVVATAGKSIRRVFEEDGEDAFRRLESEVLLEALQRGDGVVVAAAGGSVLALHNRVAIRDLASYVFWLDADHATLVERTSGGGHRPLLDGDAAERLATLAIERRPLYEEISRVRVDTTGRPLDDIVDEVERLLVQQVAS